LTITPPPPAVERDGFGRRLSRCRVTSVWRVDLVRLMIPSMPSPTRVATSPPSVILLGTATLVLLLAAVSAVIGFWPETPGYFDDAGKAALLGDKARAVTAGGVLLVAACVCWVGALVVPRVERVSRQHGDAATAVSDGGSP
jgi:hypothetical protein